MRKIIFSCLAVVAAIIIADCGGSSSTATGSGSETGGDSGSGTATVNSLASIPSMDLSTYDNSTATANVAAPVTATSKGWGEAMTEVGKSSRSGCEANMHKQEMIRMSQQIQLSRCYPEAMETVGLITIPTGSYNYYQITPPEEEGMDEKICEGIPVEDTERKEACLAGEGGSKAGKEMKMRIGIIAGMLQIDMCEGGSLVDEATYSASGSVYTVTATHIGNWAGNDEKGRFSMSVDLGTDGYVDNGIVNLGTAGSAIATGRMVGGFGSGLMNFTAEADGSNKVSGAFAGNFTDPYTDAATAFTGKVYSHFGGSSDTGCAGYSSSGTMPPRKISDMIPFNIGTTNSELEAFLNTFGNELGVLLTVSNYQDYLLCDNPDFDPANPDPTQKPLKIISAGETCDSSTHTDVECFSITNVERTGDYATGFEQIYLIIADSGSPYYDEVNNYNVSQLDPTIDAPAYERNWDCSGTFTTVNFLAVDEATMMSAVSACKELEEKAMANDGMGGYSCDIQDQMKGMNDFAYHGGEFGQYGGEYGFAESSEGKVNTCAKPGFGAPDRAGRLFVDRITDQKYCFPDGTGRCQSFTVANNIGTPDDAIAIGNWEITRIDYYPATAVEVKITYNTGAGTCDQYYFLEQHSFDAPPEFGSEGSGTKPGDAGFIPDACKDANGVPVSEQACYEICSKPGTDCRVDSGQGGEMF